MASSLSCKLVARLLQKPASVPAAASGQFHSHLGTLGALAGGNGTPGLGSLSSSTIASSPHRLSCFFRPCSIMDSCAEAHRFGQPRLAAQIISSPCGGKPYSSCPRIVGLANAGVLKVFPNRTRRFSSGPDGSDPPKEAGKAAKDHEPRHQVIRRGPTVERDVSALANETRRVLERMRKSMYDLSETLALLGLAHVVLGVWITGATQPREVWIQGIGAFAFPFSVAFLLRWTLKPLSFFHWMEEQGRLQILTLNLQVFKNLNLMFFMIRVVSLCCVLGISVGGLAPMWMP